MELDSAYSSMRRLVTKGDLACEAVPDVWGWGQVSKPKKNFRTLKISDRFPPQTPRQAEIATGS